MRKGELECIHGIGHSANNHGCDGCCFVLGIYERERIIKLISHELWVMDMAGGATFGRMPHFDEGYNTALRDIAILIKGENK